ncbi:OmpA family protein [Devosia sp. Root413D1]|uniref:OmpA family protein n=1 Tax=Devosia sp. Root413D1 TaxID=1736531 RepID=UPI0012E3E041|nr:OmpA family protein [Devosia sp. Root413D1]
MLSLLPLTALGQDAGLTAAYNAYVEAQSGDDADAKAAAEAAFLAECQRIGAPDLQQCIAIATGAATVEQPAPPAEEAAPPAEEPAPPAEEPAAPAEEPAPPPAEEPAAPAEQPAPAEPAPAAEQPAEPPAAEQPAAPAEQPAAPVEQPAAPAEQSPASDPALIAAFEAYVSAGSGGDANAKATAEAAFLAECNRLGIQSLDECLALMGGAPAPVAPAEPATPAEPAQPGEAPATDQSGQPLEVVPDQETPDAPAAPVLDSAKDAAEAGAEQPAPAQPPAAEAPPPATDAEAQTQAPPPAEEVEAAVATEGKRVDQLPAPEAPPAAQEAKKDGDRLIINIGINIDIFTPYKDRDRIGRGDEVYYEELDNGRYRQTVIRSDGTRVVTVWNRYGEIIRRVKVLPDGTRIILVFSPDDRRDDDWRDPGDELPPFYLPIPVDDYVLYSERSDEADIERFLSEPPLEKAARVYTVDEVKRSARIRDTVRRVEIGDLTFETGSAQLGRDQVGSLGKVAEAMKKILARNPGETFLIEGHTDAVGSDESNLVLSDERAGTIADLLTEFYDIPPENLTTQGYGERYLKVETDGAERANRRATVRRITSLVSGGQS